MKNFLIVAGITLAAMFFTACSDSNEEDVDSQLVPFEEADRDNDESKQDDE